MREETGETVGALEGIRIEIHLNSTSIVFGTPETYADARISTYTNETIPVDVKGTILAKVRAGWYEPRLRPGQFVYAKDCTLWQPFNGSALADDFQRDMDKPCTIVVARAGFGTIVGLLWFRQPMATSPESVRCYTLTSLDADTPAGSAP